MRCSNCILQETTQCTHLDLIAKCVHCTHLDQDHYFDDRGQCLIDGCNCNGLET